MYLNNKDYVLVTGGAGYIGSHTVKELIKLGYNIIILDNLSNGHKDLVEQVLKVKLVIGDISDHHLLREIFSSYLIKCVIHLAAYAYVEESIKNPSKYYRNNVVGTLALLEAMKMANINKLVFSSTCSTYGIPSSIPILEDHPQSPINPYGASKQMIEQILEDFSRAYDFKYVCFRYFNASGADSEGELGEDHNPETHLIPSILYTALGKRDTIYIFGTDYPTKDGTCIRDYIHVVDIAQAHLLGLEYLLNGGDSQIFNLGNAKGFSVQEVIQIAREITGKYIKIKKCERRLGDPAILVADSQKVKKILGWQPKYPNLTDMINHSWQWHLKRHS